MELTIIIKIQSWIRGILQRRKYLISHSCYQTKEWRRNRKWYKTGKLNECEKYQIDLLEKILCLKLNKTNERINMETIEIINKMKPMILENGYEWSENFDGKITIKENIYYFNLKFICDAGGAQTRTLREVYHFIKYQLEYLCISTHNKKNIYFINILDGDTSYLNINK